MTGHYVLRIEDFQSLLSLFDLDENITSSFDNYKWERFGHGSEVALFDSQSTTKNGVQRVFGLCAIDHPENGPDSAEDLLMRCQSGNTPKSLKLIPPKNATENKLYVDHTDHRLYLGEFIYPDVREES